MFRIKGAFHDPRQEADQAAKAKVEVDRRRARPGHSAPAPEAPRDLRDLARASVDRAEAALDRVEDTTMETMRFFDEASTTFKRAATELQLRAFQMAEENAGAALDYWRRLIALNDVASLADIHRDFAHRQVAAVLRQSLELSDLGLKVLDLAAPPPGRLEILRPFGLGSPVLESVQL